MTFFIQLVTKTFCVGSDCGVGPPVAAFALQLHIPLQPALAPPRLKHTGFPFQMEQGQLSRFCVPISVGSTLHVWWARTRRNEQVSELDLMAWSDMQRCRVMETNGDTDSAGDCRVCCKIKMT